MQSQKPQHNKIFRSAWWREMQWKILKMKCTINATLGQKFRLFPAAAFQTQTTPTTATK